MHGASDVDIEFLVCFLRELGRFHIVNVERALDARIVDEAVKVWVLLCDLLNKVWYRGDIAGVQDVVCLRTNLECRLFQLRLCAPDDDDVLAVFDELLRERFANATAAAGHESGLEIVVRGGHFECVRRLLLRS